MRGGCGRVALSLNGHHRVFSLPSESGQFLFLLKITKSMSTCSISRFCESGLCGRRARAKKDLCSLERGREKEGKTDARRTGEVHGGLTALCKFMVGPRMVSGAADMCRGIKDLRDPLLFTI